MEVRYFQQLIGDDANTIKIFDSVEEEDGILYVTFKDGSRCNEDMIAPIGAKNIFGKVMAEVTDPNNLWTFNTEWVGRQEEIYAENADGEKVCVQPFVEGRKKLIPIPPRPVSSNFGQIKKHISTPQINTQEVENTQPIIQQKEIIQEVKQTKDDNYIDLTNPVFLTLSKAKKVDTAIDMTLTISLPPKSLYNVIKESFEEGDNTFIEYIIKSMDVNYLKQMIGDAVKTMYESEEN